MLPLVMVAPNGARRTKRDHPQLPIAVSETVAAARECHEAGAQALHAHVRDARGRHSLDAGRYRELLALMAQSVPNMMVQITTESAGIYSSEDQRALLAELKPPAASVAIREMLSDGDRVAATKTYRDAMEAAIGIQHILYDAADIALLQHAYAEDIVPSALGQVLLVMGQYDERAPARLSDLKPLQRLVAERLPHVDAAVCAFGREETAILRQALRGGWKVRVGFENNLHSSDGSLAPSNAARVREILGGDARGPK
ncbi:MAG: 3-keto-5-aminohexanoate cleavage protein [Rhodobacteraceae bacterium]|nr:3-keto-5-aminohexanoate cleavage protein [Paracoccaceae bacterium]